MEGKIYSPVGKFAERAKQTKLQRQVREHTSRQLVSNPVIRLSEYVCLSVCPSVTD